MCEVSFNYVPQGWQCPICNNVMSPNTTVCMFCPTEGASITIGGTATVATTAILVSSDEDSWEGLYVNGKLKDEGYTLNEGEERITYFVKLSKKYNFNLEDMVCITLTQEQEKQLEQDGGFPLTASELANWHNKDIEEI